VTAKLNSDGEPVWTAFYNFPGLNVTPVGISVDSNFIVSVYTQISDSTTSDYAFIKYSQCDTSCVFRISNAFANAQLNVIKDVVNFYPNPANNLLTVEYSLNGNNCKIQLIDIIGRVVVNKQLNPGSNRIVLDIEHLTSGIYSVVITNGDKIEQVDKLAIVR
ncbi:MAG: T9SS type A sorting domain-containing protein, partial [Bacteroidia bacterium]